MTLSIDENIYTADLKYAEQAIELKDIMIKSHPWNRQIAVGDPYLEIEVPLNNFNNAAKSFELKILDTAYTTWDKETPIMSYNLTPWLNSPIDIIDWNYWECSNSIEWFCGKDIPGGEITIKWRINTSESINSEYLDIVYYFDSSVSEVHCYSKDQTRLWGQGWVETWRRPLGRNPFDGSIGENFRWGAIFISSSTDKAILDFTNKALYIPIRYWGGSPSESQNAKVDIKFTIDNGEGYYDEGRLTAFTRTKEYPNYIKVSMQEWYNKGTKHTSLPCIPGITQCLMNLKEAKITLPLIKNKLDRRCNS